MRARLPVSVATAGRSNALVAFVSAVLVLSACAAAFAQLAETGHMVLLRQPLTPELESIAREVFSQDREMHEYLEPFPPEAPKEEQEIPVIYGAFIDLADDGNPAAVFYISSIGFCGTVGCPLEIFRRQGGGWQHVASTTAGSEAILILGRMDKGFHRISVDGPTGCDGNRLLYWDGKEYLDIDPCPPGRG